MSSGSSSISYGLELGGWSAGAVDCYVNLGAYDATDYEGDAEPRAVSNEAEEVEAG